MTGRRRHKSTVQPRPVTVLEANASPTMVEVMRIYDGSDGDATMGLYRRLGELGPIGTVAADVFRAQKCSERAKAYRGGTGGQSYRQMAYDRKQWSMNKLAATLVSESHRFGITWGWAVDRHAAGPHSTILYIDLPTGQVSWHTEARGVGPDYPGAWDEIRGQAALRICRWCAQLLDGASA